MSRTRSCHLDEDSPAIFCAHTYREPFPGRSTSKDYQASHLFCMLELPAEVDPARCTAILSNGLLGVHMPKAVANAEHTSIPPKLYQIEKIMEEIMIEVKKLLRAFAIVTAILMTG